MHRVLDTGVLRERPQPSHGAGQEGDRRERRRRARVRLDASVDAHEAATPPPSSDARRAERSEKRYAEAVVAARGLSCSSTTSSTTSCCCCCVDSMHTAAVQQLTEDTREVRREAGELRVTLWREDRTPQRREVLRGAEQPAQLFADRSEARAQTLTQARLAHTTINLHITMTVNVTV